MGMYDTVKREPVKCPGCGRELKSFQSKSGFCQLLTVTPEQLVEDCYRKWGYRGAEYYAYCLNGCWGELAFEYDPEKRKWRQRFFPNEQLDGGKQE